MHPLHIKVVYQTEKPHTSRNMVMEYMPHFPRNLKSPGNSICGCCDMMTWPEI